MSAERVGQAVVNLLAQDSREWRDQLCFSVAEALHVQPAQVDVDVYVDGAGSVTLTIEMDRS